MQYKGYSASVEFDEDGLVFHGRIAGIRAIVDFHAERAEDLPREFQESVDAYLEFCAEDGIEPERPFSADIVVKADPDLQRRLYDIAAAEGSTVEEVIRSVLSRALPPTPAAAAE